ncbi:MAG: dihydropteroate synthase [Eubacteriales bacterium]|nr:dihydropteroate synthase [Eubacteriales bacterium]
MIIISEKLNSSIPSVYKLMDKCDTDGIKKLIEEQLEAGSEYMDLNTALFGDGEWEKMQYVIDILKDYDCGIMIDSTNPDTVKTALEYIKGKKTIVNSLTLTARFNEVAPLVAQYGCGIVGLPIDNNGTPATAKDRIHNANQLIVKLKDIGIKEENIFIDAIAEACAVNDQSAKIVADTVRGIKESNENVHITCGLSNISFGLPKRAAINSGFINILSYCGMDSAILNPATKDMRMAIATASLLTGADEYCMEYITTTREIEE